MYKTFGTSLYILVIATLDFIQHSVAFLTDCLLYIGFFAV